MTRGGVDLGLGFTVTPENVLDAYAVIAEEATRLNLSVRFFQRAVGEGMPLCGGDPVSADASRGFTHLAGKLAELCRKDVNELVEVADSLARVARAYGISEEQIAGAFNRDGYRYQPAPALFPEKRGTR
jgi:hypothetical protein